MTMLNIPVLHGAALDRPDEADTLDTALAVREALTRLGHAAEIVQLRADFSVAPKRPMQRPDLVFNLVDSVGGQAELAAEAPEDFDRRGLRYTGCGARATRLCASKPLMKRILADAGLPTPAWSATGAGLEGAPLTIVKSATEHASLGIDAGSVVPGARAAVEIARRALRHGGRFFAEVYVEGREFNLSLLQGPAGPELLPPAEISFTNPIPGRPRIVDYDAKWIAHSHGYNNTPRRFDFPPSDATLLAELGALALDCWRLFGLDGYARVDFRVDEAGRPWILEVNTNPCLAPDAGFVAAAKRAKLGYDELIDRIVGAALAPARKAA